MRQFFYTAIVLLLFNPLTAALPYPDLNILVNVIEESDEKEEKLMAYYNLLEGLFWLKDTLNGDLYLQKMKDFSEDSYPEVAQGLVDILYGHRSINTGRGLAKSIEHTLDGVTFLEKSNFHTRSSLEILGGGYDLAGYIFQTGAEYDLAYFYYKRAEKLSKAARFTTLLWVVYNDLSSLYSYGFNDREKGLEYLKAALKVAEKEDHQAESLGKLNSNLGEYYAGDTNYDLAKTYFEKAVKYQKEANNKEGLADAYAGLAKLNYKLNELVMAREYANLSLENAEENCYWCHDIQYTLGDISMEEGDYPEARKRFENGRKIAKQYEAAEADLNGILLLADLEGHLKNWEQAGRLYKEGYFMKDSMLGTWKVNNVAEIQTANELSQIEREKRALIDDNQDLDMQVELQRKVLVLSLVILLLSVIIGVAIYLSRKRLKKSHRLLVQKSRLLVVESSSETSLLGHTQPLTILTGSFGPSNREVTISEPQENDDSPDSSTTPNLNLNQAEEELVKKIKFMFEEEEVFLDQELTLASLAEKLNTNTSYLSKVINQAYSKGFRRVVNEYRIQRVLESFEREEFKTLTIFALAQKAGFKSKSAFNSAFNQFTGVTPTFYIKNMNG